MSYALNRGYPNLQLYSLTSFWASFLLLEILLLQGSVYWYSKLKRLRIEHTSVTPTRVVQQFKSLRKLNLGLIIAPIMMFIIDFIKWYPALPLAGLIFVGCIYIFAILEYINYFHVQLSYDNSSDLKYLLKTKKLKQACISRDFERISKVEKLNNVKLTE